LRNKHLQDSGFCATQQATAIAMRGISSLAMLAQPVGQEIAVLKWVQIDQERINRFADASGECQWIHVDSAGCRQMPDIGRTIAYGFLTLSMIFSLMQESIDISGRQGAELRLEQSALSQVRSGG
jgi:acyl dehydratase